MTPAVDRAVARGGALGLIGSVSAAVGGLALTLVVGRALPARDVGVYFTVVAGFTIASSVLLLGADTGLVRGLSALRAEGRSEALRPMVRAALVPVVLASLVVAALVAMFADPLSHRVFDASTAPRAATALRLLAPFLVASTLAGALLNGASRGLGTLRTFVLGQQVLMPVARPVLLVGAVLLWSRLRPADDPAVVALLTWALPLPVAAWLGARSVRRRLPPWPTDPGPPQRFWRGTAPRGVAAVFEVLLVWADVVLVTVLLGPAQAGVYAAASRFVTSGTFALQGIRVAIAPMLAQAFAAQDPAAAGQVHRLGVRWAILSTWPVYLGLATLAPGVLAVLGPGFAGAATALVVLSIAMLGVAATGNANTVLNMAHRSHWAALNTGGAVAVMLALDLLLVPRLGIVGAALGWSAALLTDAALGVLETQRGLRLRSFDAGSARAAAVAVVGFGLPALGVRLLLEALPGGAPAAVLLLGGGVVGAACYAALLVTQRRALALDDLVAALRRRGSRPDAAPARPDPASPTGPPPIPMQTPAPTQTRSPA